MRHGMKTPALSLALSLILVAGGASAQPAASAPPATQPTARAGGLKIKLATVYVDDQAKALRFYTEVLGFEKKADVSHGGYRWLTVTAPGDREGTELLLALNDNPAAKAYQKALFKKSEPAAMFFTDDLKGAYERIQASGGKFTMAPTEVMPGSTIATLNDTCGNVIQITQLDP